MVSQIVILAIVLLSLDLIWINFFMKYRYENILNKILSVKSNIRIIPAIIAYAIMIFALYYFAMKDNLSIKESTFNACLLGLIMYGVYDSTLYSIFPIDDIDTGIIDVLWGIFVCGASVYITKSMKF
jgi:uncharacterized membrane protein